MAILNKDVTRESTIEVDGRNVIVTMTQNQRISMRLKGLGKARTVSIDIEKLFKQISGMEVEEETPNLSGRKPKPDDKNLINLGRVRDAFLVADIPYEQKVVFARFVKEILAENK